MYNISKEVLKEVVTTYIGLAKKLKGELVLVNKVSDESDEYVITNIKDLSFLNIKKGDLIEATIYVDDDDEVFEEFKIGSGQDDTVVREKIVKPSKEKKNEKDLKKDSKKVKTKVVEKNIKTDRKEEVKEEVKKEEDKKIEKQKKKQVQSKKIELNKDSNSSHFQKFMKKK